MLHGRPRPSEISSSLHFTFGGFISMVDSNGRIGKTIAMIRSRSSSQLNETKSGNSLKNLSGCRPVKKFKLAAQEWVAEVSLSR